MTSPRTFTTLAQALSKLQTLGLERLDAQLLLLHVLGRPGHQRSWLLAHDSDAFPAEQAGRLAALAERRITGEPLAYLTGHKEFYGLDFCVDGRVLVPRPDTETLVNWALEVLASPSGHVSPPPKGQAWGEGDDPSLLDLGTGSGAIALALKSQLSRLQVHATDVSADALTVAQTNAGRLQLDVKFSQGPWFAALPVACRLFDCIVSNPPYIAQDDPHLNALAHEPEQALTSGTDGLDDIRHIIEQAPTHLKPGGWLLLEHGYDQAAAVRTLLAASGFTAVQSRRDLAGIERCSGAQMAFEI